VPIAAADLVRGEPVGGVPQPCTADRFPAGQSRPQWCQPRPLGEATTACSRLMARYAQANEAALTCSCAHRAFRP